MLRSPSALRLLILTAGILAFPSHGGLAQNITQTYTIPLETFAYPSPDSPTYYKYGIRVSIGDGASAKTFEFDTGGEGFYAAYSDHADWWGTGVTVTDEEFSKNFGSGIQYDGHTAYAGELHFYGADSIPILTVSGAYKVGHADHIYQNSSTLWSPTSPSTVPPIQEHFYGDFGLSLKKGAHGIENVFAQLSYGPGITAGYIVSTGTYGSPNGTASVQIGLAADDLNNPDTIWFTMSGSSATEHFSGSGYATYSAELITASVQLSNGTDSYVFDLGLNLDTGNPTPGILYEAGSPDAEALLLFSNTGSSGEPISLLPGTTMLIQATSLSGSEDSILQFVTGTTYGKDFVYAESRSGGDYSYLNIGALLFQSYDVIYNLESGQIGLTSNAIPEANTLSLVFLTLVLFLSIRSYRRSFQTNARGG